MNLKYFISFLLVSFFILSSANADSTLTNRMKARLPEVLSAKNNGVIGENVDGMLLVRIKTTEEVENLVNAENKDRKNLFELLAKKTGGETGDVAKKFAKGIASKSKKGHWFKKSSGSWVSK